MFGKRIQQFVLSVDVMDEVIYKELVSLVESYVREELNIHYFSLLESHPVNEGPGLQTFWSTREDKPSYSIKNVDDQYTSHTSYVFDKKTPIWVVGVDREPLQDAKATRDLWLPGAEDLPPYSARLKEEIRTSIMMPLLRSGSAFGVVEFATGDYVEPTKSAIEELKTIGQVLSRVCRMDGASRAQRDSTRKAMDMLKAARKEEQWMGLALPRLFVASAGTADDDVMSVIRNTVGALEGKVKSVDWEEMNAAGNINQQVISAIATADFGLCYFSEPADSDTAEHPYRDNANVIFEAGMMQALTNSPGAQPEGWIPIREAASPGAPFDFASERMLIVPRADDETLEVEKFADSLKKRLDALIGESEE